MFAGVTSSSRATCPNTELRRRDRRSDTEVRPVRCSTFIISDSVVPSVSMHLLQLVTASSYTSLHNQKAAIAGLLVARGSLLPHCE